MGLNIHSIIEQENMKSQTGNAQCTCYVEKTIHQSGELALTAPRA